MTGASLEIRSVLVSSSYHKSYYNTTAVQACCRWGAAVYVRYVLCKHYTSIYITCNSNLVYSDPSCRIACPSAGTTTPGTAGQILIFQNVPLVPPATGLRYAHIPQANVQELN